MIKKPIRLSQLFILMFLSAFLLSCTETPIPRPRAFFRIALPEKAYTSFDTTYPYKFDVPEYADIIPDNSHYAEPYWINMDIADFKARIHISYKEIDGNLDEYIDDSYNMAMKHIPKSTGISQERIAYPEHNVYGILYNIGGSGTASPMQFFLTDSSNHFLRAALYFGHAPNNDSLKPVIDFLSEDIDIICSSLEWK